MQQPDVFRLPQIVRDLRPEKEPQRVRIAWLVSGIFVLGAIAVAAVIIARWPQLTQKDSANSDPVTSKIPGSLNPETTISWDDGIDQNLEQINIEVETLLEETK